MNYYAVLGLKARICLYAKDVTAAYGAANEVILAQQQKGLFPWVKTADITTTEANLRDRTFSSEHLFAFNTTKGVRGMYEDDKYKVTIDVTDYEWKELLHMCIDLHMSPDALATAFCKEVIRQQALLRIIAAALEEKYDGMLDDIREL